jgi:hypothetical protein
VEIDGLPVIDVDESEEITVAVTANDLAEGDIADPEQHPIAIALRRQEGVDDARVTERETLVRRGKRWFRYDGPDKRRFKELQKTLASKASELDQTGPSLVPPEVDQGKPNIFTARNRQK